MTVVLIRPKQFYNPVNRNALINTTILLLVKFVRDALPSVEHARLTPKVV